MKNLLVFFFILCTSFCFSQNRNYKTINVALKAHFDSICKYDTTSYKSYYEWSLKELIKDRKICKPLKSVIRKSNNFLLIESMPLGICQLNRYFSFLFYDDTLAIVIDETYSKNIPGDNVEDKKSKEKFIVFNKSFHDINFQESLGCYIEMLDTTFNYSRLRECPSFNGDYYLYVFTIFKSGKARVLLGYLNYCDINPETCKYEPSEAIKELMNKKKE